MNEKIICLNCGFRFANNHLKHKHRQKLCPNCLSPYTKTWKLWKPNLKWLREKLAQITRKKETKEKGYRDRAIHNLWLELGREPSESEIEHEVNRVKDLERQQKLLEQLKKRGGR